MLQENGNSCYRKTVIHVAGKGVQGTRSLGAGNELLHVGRVLQRKRIVLIESVSSAQQPHLETGQANLEGDESDNAVRRYRQPFETHQADQSYEETEGICMVRFITFYIGYFFLVEFYRTFYANPIYLSIYYKYFFF